MAWLDRTARSLFLAEFVGALKLAMGYFFGRKATINYPHEKGRSARASAASMRCAATRTAGAVHRLQAVRSGLPGPGYHH